MNEIVADIGDWVEFEYKNLLGYKEKYRGFIIDAWFVYEAYRISVPNVGTFRVPFRKIIPLPVEIDEEGAAAIADIALDVKDEEWFRNILNFKLQEVNDDDK